MQPDAAMRSRAAEPGNLVAAVNGEAAKEEDRGAASARCNRC